MKYLILGAGPAGLTFANKLKQMGENDFLVLEKEGEAGGLCRTVKVDGFPFDIGGGHFLDICRPAVLKFLFDFMPEKEWCQYNRDSRICINGDIIGHPIEANIWQMEIENQIEYIKSIAVAGCNLGKEMPTNFLEWIYWKFGVRIAEDYMIPYNRKIFGKEFNQLGTYWLEKLPNVSLEETLRSYLTRKVYGKQPAHTKFYYPEKYGYGEIWLRMAKTIKGHIEYHRPVNGIDFTTRTVTVSDGTRYQADVIVTTIPWMEFKRNVGMPDTIQSLIKELKYSSIETRYYPERISTDAQWIYYPDSELPYHRILVRHNFCPGSRGYWTETNKENIREKDGGSGFRYLNQYAYPLNTIKKPEIMRKILEWGKKQNVFGLGRWGEHQHYNSDVVVELALKMAEQMKR